MRKLILRNGQSPGDMVMLTAAVQDLKRVLGAAVAVDVRTRCPALWEHSPNLTPLADGAACAEEIAYGYPPVHRSNTGPWHFPSPRPPKAAFLRIIPIWRGPRMRRNPSGKTS